MNRATGKQSRRRAARLVWGALAGMAGLLAAQPMRAELHPPAATILVEPLPPALPQDDRSLRHGTGASPVPVFVHDGAVPRPRPRPAGLAGPVGGAVVDPGTDAIAAVIVQSLLGRASRLSAPPETGLPPLATAPPVFRSPRPRMRPPLPPAILAEGARPSPRTALSALPAPALQSTPAPQSAPSRRLARMRPGATGPATGPASAPGGGLCGDARILGQALAPIRGRLPGCRIDRPVRIESIAGVGFSQHPVLNCDTARALADWITGGLLPATRSRGRVVQLSVPSHYACRTRNSRPGAKLSEHARGNAIDITAITFADGRRLTVKEGWKKRRDRRLLRRLHAAACGPFGTVLGPDADIYHQDNIHFDTARYRGGPYCR